MVTNIGPNRTRSYRIKKYFCEVLELWWTTLQEKILKKKAIQKNKTSKIKRLENNLSFPTALALYSWKHLFLNCPACSIIVLDQQSYRLTEQAVVVQSSKKVMTTIEQQGLG